MGKMVKLANMLLVVALAVALLLTSCSSGKPAPAPAEKAPAVTPAKTAPASPGAPAAKPASARVPFDQQQLPKYVVATGSAGGEAWIMGSSLAALVTKYTPMKSTVTLIPGAQGKVEPVRRGEIDYFFYGPSQPWQIYNGTLGGQGKIPKLRLRVLAANKGEEAIVYGLWVLAKSSIKEGKDLKGKRIGIRAGVEWSPEIPLGIMRANGWTEKDYVRVDTASIGAAFDSLVEGKIDAYSGVTGSQALEVHKTVGLRHLALTKQEADEIVKIDPALVAGMTPVNHPVVGPSHLAMLGFGVFWSRADLSEKVGYTMMKALWENLDEFHKGYFIAADFFLKNAMDNVWLMPYHPGAVRYYKEKGAWTDAHTARQRAALEAEKKLYGDLLESDVAAFKELGILQ